MLRVHKASSTEEKEAFFVLNKSCRGVKCLAANRRKTNMTSDLVLLSRQESFSNPTMNETLEKTCNICHLFYITILHPSLLQMAVNNVNILDLEYDVFAVSIYIWNYILYILSSYFIMI